MPGGFELRHKEGKAFSLEFKVSEVLKTALSGRGNLDLPVKPKARPGAAGQSWETGN